MKIEVLGDRVDLDQVPSTVEARITFFDGSLLLNIFLCRRSFLICEECCESIAEMMGEDVCHGLFD